MEINAEEIIKNLSEQEYPVEKATRMKGTKGEPTAMVLVEINQKYKSI